MADTLIGTTSGNATAGPATVALPSPPEPSIAVASPDHRGPLATLAAALTLPLVLFAIMRPETFGITPNSLDPMFYTGLAVNFDDALPNGIGHYFISRWSAWYPLYLSNLVAGPIVGRLLLRLVLVAAVLFGLWRLRPRWTWSQRILAGTVLVTSPMFLRPLMTDYVEYAFVAFGIGLVLLALSDNQTGAKAMGAGALTALMVAANPLAVTAAAPPLVMMVVAQNRGLGRRIGMSLLIVLSGAAMLLGALFWFRWVHDIPNLYQPTVDFVRNAPGPDLLKSPRLEWLARFTWLYIPPLLLAMAAAVAWRSDRRLDRTEWLALGLAGAQWGLQWVDQFVRDGTGLEISYYWSLAFPSTGVALALLVGRVAGDLRLRWAAALLVGWLALLSVGVPDVLRLPAGVGFAVVAVMVVAALTVLLPRFPLPALGLFLAFVAWTQIGAPRYDPDSYHFFNASPRYDELFGSDGDEAEALQREALWFEEQMEAFPRDLDAAFFPVEGLASPVVGLFHPHVSGQLVGFDPETGELGPADRVRLVAVNYPQLVLVGPPEFVADAADEVVALLGLGPPRLDVTHDSGLGYRLVVFDLLDTPALPISFEASDLPVLVGVADGDDVLVEAGGPAGFVTYGPYLMLPPGRYGATIDYTAFARPDVTAGELDVNSRDLGRVEAGPLPGTAGKPSSVSISFEVDTPNDLWEFRTLTDGSTDMIIHSVTVRLE